MDNEISKDLNEEIIQSQMEETRASLTAKLETLEQKVVGTVEGATTTVTETVDAIKETVHDTVATVQEGVKDSVESVKDLFDVPAHVQRRPWLILGGSVAVGYCLGTLLMRSSKSQEFSAPALQPSWQPNASNGVGSSHRAQGIPPPSAPPEEPSIYASEVAKLKGLALGVLFGTARELLVSSLPPEMGEQLKDVVDSVTKKVGGEPLSSSEWGKLREETPPQQDHQVSPETDREYPATRRW